MAKRKGHPQTITINARKNRKDKSLMKLINEYASEFCEGMEPKIALAFFIKEYMPAKIAELKKAKAEKDYGKDNRNKQRRRFYNRPCKS